MFSSLRPWPNVPFCWWKLTTTRRFRPPMTWLCQLGRQMNWQQALQLGFDPWDFPTLSSRIDGTNNGIFTLVKLALKSNKFRVNWPVPGCLPWIPKQLRSEHQWWNIFKIFPFSHSRQWEKIVSKTWILFLSEVIFRDSIPWDENHHESNHRLRQNMSGCFLYQSPNKQIQIFKSFF